MVSTTGSATVGPEATAAASRGRDVILRFHCPDRPGILAGVTRVVFEQGGDIRDAAQFGDEQTGRFFVRIHLAAPPGFSTGDFAARFEPVAETFALEWDLYDLARKPKVLIAVSRLGHCLHDLLHRWQAGLLPMEVSAVVSNHEAMRSLVDWHRLPYHYLPVTPETRDEQEARLLALMRDSGAELLVLARYMQILSPSACEALKGRCINIHHSFLPGFKGARPYERAHQRGKCA